MKELWLSCPWLSCIVFDFVLWLSRDFCLWLYVIRGEGGGGRDTRQMCEHKAKTNTKIKIRRQDKDNEYKEKKKYKRRQDKRQDIYFPTQKTRRKFPLILRKSLSLSLPSSCFVFALSSCLVVWPPLICPCQARDDRERGRFRYLGRWDEVSNRDLSSSLPCFVWFLGRWDEVAKIDSSIWGGNLSWSLVSSCLRLILSCLLFRCVCVSLSIWRCRWLCPIFWSLCGMNLPAPSCLCLFVSLSSLIFAAMRSHECPWRKCVNESRSCLDCLGLSFLSCLWLWVLSCSWTHEARRQWNSCDEERDGQHSPQCRHTKEAYWRKQRENSHAKITTVFSRKCGGNSRWQSWWRRRG